MDTANTNLVKHEKQAGRIVMAGMLRPRCPAGSRDWVTSLRHPWGCRGGLPIWVQYGWLAGPACQQSLEEAVRQRCNRCGLLHKTACANPHPTPWHSTESKRRCLANHHHLALRHTGQKEHSVLKWQPEP